MSFSSLLLPAQLDKSEAAGRTRNKVDPTGKVSEVLSQLFRICDTSGNINIHAAVNDVHDELLSSVLPPPICLRMTPMFSRWGM
ncbi:hypothetical protein G5714_010458 [Onychostoma macrolepis]|uniref:Uncharacterized protein n=1 Tax=Onychostoma macrolepis TaxID=369639 RepID=A0A7J6CRZ3_9TELE|nr:hypothetical protein G5714_010458 [Onychostoma macrolepis]